MKKQTKPCASANVCINQQQKAAILDAVLVTMETPSMPNVYPR